MGSASESTSNGWEPSTAAHVWAHESVIQKYLSVTRRMGGRIIVRRISLVDSLMTLHTFWAPHLPKTPRSDCRTHLKAAPSLLPSTGWNLRQDSFGNTPCVT